jgi:site-specific recombinase XerD
MGHVRSDHQRCALNQLVARTLSHFEELGYTERTRKYYSLAWRPVIHFACSTSLCSKRVRDFALKFLTKRRIPRGKARTLTWFQQLIRRGLNVLMECQETGDFRRHPKRIADPKIPRGLARERDRYESFCGRHLGHRPSTVAARLHMLKWFLLFLGSRGIKSTRRIRPPLLAAFIAERARQVSTRSLATEIGSLRSFLRFLGMRGLIAADLVAHVRGLRCAKEHRLPPVWPAAGVKALLAAVDRSSAVGKRNYAMLLLATRLGLRASDIRTLELDDLRWAEDRITLNQSKTGRALTLPMDGEVGAALIDYLQFARPRTASRIVFLKARAPHEPLGTSGSVCAVVVSNARKAGIKLPPGVPCGVHSLRHTLATRLVQAGQRLETVAGVLGHASVESTQVYTHLDVLALRSVALDPDEVFRGK